MREINEKLHLRYVAVTLSICLLVWCGTSLVRGEVVSRPATIGDGWRTSTPSAEGLDGARIAKITKDIANGRFKGIHSYLIIKNGKLVHEFYNEGYTRDDLQPIYSITKSVTSALVGIAVDRGDIPGIHETVAKLLPEYSDAIVDSKVRNITLEHLLTLTSGFDWDEKTHGYGDRRNSECRMVSKGSWVAHLLGLPVRDEPGERYVYNTGSVHLISAIIKSRTGMYADEYARRYLFEPLGIEVYEWNKDPEGYPCTGGTHGGLRLRARDLAKFAFLFINEGRWGTQQVVPGEWVIESTGGKAAAHPGIQIGYLWWTGHYVLSGRKLRHFYGAGYGGQSISFVPELDLLVVFTAWSRAKDADFLGPLLMTINAALKP